MSEGSRIIHAAAFVDALKNGTPMPIDVYDSATWQAVSVLSEISIRNGGAPQAMPDFTNGKWQNREPYPKVKYSLSDIVVDESISVV